MKPTHDSSKQTPKEETRNIPPIGTTEFNQLCAKHFSGHPTNEQEEGGYTPGVLELLPIDSDTYHPVALVIKGAASNEGTLYIASMTHCPNKEEAIANAQRIVYAWNNIDTFSNLVSVQKGEIQNAEDRIRAVEKELNKANAENERLREALKRLHDFITDKDYGFVVQGLAAARFIDINSQVLPLITNKP